MAQLMRTSNPALNDRIFRNEALAFGDVMTLNGTVNKTGLLLVFTFAAAAWSWNAATTTPDRAGMFMALGAIGGFIAALATIFMKSWAPVTAPIYAVLEGLLLGSISALFEARYPGIAITAVGLTFGTLFALLMVYRTGIIRVTDKFRLGVVAATGGIALFYFLSFILGFFGVHFTSVFGSGLIGIGFSLVVVGVAAMNLILDFDFIERGVAFGSPKYMEWYSGFALLVTLIWLYMEILRLLSKLRSRD